MTLRALLHNFETFAGFWLNVVGLLLALVLLLFLVRTEQAEIARRRAQAEEHMQHLLAAVRKGDVGSSYAEVEIRTLLESIWFNRGTPWFNAHPLDELKQARRGQGYNVLYYNNLVGRLKRLSDEVLLEVPRLRTPDVNPTVDKVGAETQAWLTETSMYVSRWPIYIIWFMVAMAYCTVVWCMYYGRRPQLNTGESMLNIVDVGVYFALISWAGGISSPLKWVLVASMAAATYDFCRLWRERSILATYGDRKLAVVDYVGHFSASIVYMFFLWTGLSWLSMISPDNLSGPLLFSTAIVFSITLLGVICAGLMWLVVRLQNSDRSRHSHAF